MATSSDRPVGPADPAQLERLLEAREKTIAALMRRVHRQQTGEDSGFELFRSSVVLQKRLHHQDDELSQLRTRLAAEVEAHQEALQHRARLERSLAEAGRIEALGRLAGGVAHEINTPTQYVGDNLRFLAGCVEQIARVLEWAQQHAPETVFGDGTTAADIEYLRNEMPEAIRQSLEGIENIGGIVRSMKELCHPGTKTKAPVDLARVLETAVKVSRSEWKYRAEMQLELDPSLPTVPGFASELGQVFLNLFVNCAHAIEDRGPSHHGRITVRTRRDHDHAVVEVQDDGCGMPEHVRKRVFEPFFTTKKVGRGTGQGLPLAHSVIRQKHGGSIEVDSEVGVGTTVRIRLPLQAETDGAPPPASGPPS